MPALNLILYIDAMPALTIISTILHNAVALSFTEILMVNAGIVSFLPVYTNILGAEIILEFYYD